MSVVHAVCRLEDLADGEIRRVEVDGREIALIRVGDRVYALADRCSHQNVSLSDGEIDLDEMVLECPKHGAAFSLETGEAMSLPATRGVASYDVEVTDGDVRVVVS